MHGPSSVPLSPRETHHLPPIAVDGTHNHAPPAIPVAVAVVGAPLSTANLHAAPSATVPVRQHRHTGSFDSAILSLPSESTRHLSSGAAEHPRSETAQSSEVSIPHRQLVPTVSISVSQDGDGLAESESPKPHSLWEATSALSSAAASPLATSQTSLTSLMFRPATSGSAAGATGPGENGPITPVSMLSASHPTASTPLVPEHAGPSFLAAFRSASGMSSASTGSLLLAPPGAGQASSGISTPSLDMPKSPMNVPSFRKAHKGQIPWKKGYLLGRGAFGKVYCGLNTQTGQLMAVKIVRIARATHADVGSAQELREPADGADMGSTLVQQHQEQQQQGESNDQQHDSSGEQLALLRPDTSEKALSPSKAGETSPMDSLHPFLPGREVYEREIALLERLKHPNIVSYYGTALMGDTLQIFMEYVPGGSIATMLAQFGAFHEDVTRRYLYQLVVAVAFLHANGVVHRDLKGANILVDPTGQIKLIDFGAAKMLCQEYIRSNVVSLGGTPYWMAPEVVKQAEVTTKSDIWSIGCCMYEMLTGQPPFSELGSVAAIFHIGCGGKVPRLPTASESAQAFMDAVFCSEPKDRPDAPDLLTLPFFTDAMEDASLSPTRPS
jgi:serine/threonine protein kinase